ncbi:MAG: hypothetical protein LBS56_01335, partial [Propionibacteriaceae bacterium]|nr:hypothetical protein [Propionibacteriaceae bacterium]
MADTRPTACFTPLVVAEYDERRRNLDEDSVNEAVARAAEFAAEFGAGAEAPQWRVDPSETKKHRLLERLAQAGGPSDADTGGAGIPDADEDKTCFVYWLGHGVDRGSEAAPVLRASNTTGGDGQPVEDPVTHEDFGDKFAKLLRRPGTFPVLLLDACRGDSFVQHVKTRIETLINSDKTAAEPSMSRDYLLVSAESAEGESFAGKTVRDLSQVLGFQLRHDPTIEVADLANQLTVRGPAPDSANQLTGQVPAPDPDIDVAGLARRTAELASPPAVEFGRTTGARKLVRARPAPPAGLPLVDQDEYLTVIEKAGPDVVQSFLPKGGWGEQAGELTWGFVGREAEREQIAHWLASGRGGLLAVTGDPGAGKSALLGDVVMRANASVRDALINAELAEKSDWDSVFEERGWSAAVNLVGLTAKEAAERLGAEAFGAEWARPMSAPAGPAEDPVRRLLAMVKRSGPGLSFLVDGLDESVEPWRVAGDLLAPLAALEGVSVLVGTRRSVDSRPGPTRPEDDGLVRALGGHSPVEVRRDRNAMSAYLEARITRRIDTVRPDLAARAASAVSAVEGQPFLYARLAAFELEAADDPSLLAESITADGPAAALGAGCAEVLAKALDRIKAADPANTAILQALALAQGRGIPEKDGVWTAAAQGLAPAGVQVTAAETRALFDSRARDYITGERDLDQTVYRFAHRTFQEAVLDDLRAQAPDPATAEAHAHAKVAAALTDAAWRTLTSAEGKTTLNPYIAHHLPAHCALAGGDSWKSVEARALVLDHLDPSSV